MNYPIMAALLKLYKLHTAVTSTAAVSLEWCVYVWSICAAVDGVLQRMTIVGVLLSFRSLAQEALLDVCYRLYNILTCCQLRCCCCYCCFSSLYQISSTFTSAMSVCLC